MEHDSFTERLLKLFIHHTFQRNSHYIILLILLLNVMKFYVVQLELYQDHHISTYHDNIF